MKSGAFKIAVLVMAAAVATGWCGCASSGPGDHDSDISTDGGSADGGHHWDTGTGVDGGSAQDASLEDGGLLPLLRPPVASAGPDQIVLPGQKVELTGSGSIAGSGELRYEWSQVKKLSDPEVTLTSYTGMTSGFYSPVAQCALTFRLRISDRNGMSEDTVRIHVIPKGGPGKSLYEPAVLAASGGGDFDIPPTYSISIDGSKSIDQSGSHASVSYCTMDFMIDQKADLYKSDQCKFTSPSVSERVIAAARVEILREENGILLSSAPDSALLFYDTTHPSPETVKSPIVDSVIIHALPKQSVTLSAIPGVVEAEGVIWYQVWGPPVALSGRGSFTAELTAPLRYGPYVFAAKSRAGDLWSAPSFAEVFVWGGEGFEQPVANAGDPIEAAAGSMVKLDGTASTVDEKRTADITYKWEQTAGRAVELSSETAPKPTFIAAEAGIYAFMLTVSDGVVGSYPDTVLVTVK